MTRSARAARLSRAAFLDGHEEALRATVEARAADWFPDLAHLPRAQVRLVERRARPRCFLYRFDVGSGPASRAVLAKVRHSHAALRRAREEHLAIFAPPDLPDAEVARREYAGLKMIEELFAARPDPRCGYVAPLAYLPEHPAVLMEYVPQPTLREVLLARPRRGPRGLRALAGEVPWRNAGAWLRAFHGADPLPGLPTQRDDRDDVLRLLDELASYVGRRLDDARDVEQLREVTAERALAVLPPRLPTAVAHGDFVPRNVLVAPAGRVSVIDPMPMSRVPVLEDISRFLVAMRVMDVHSLVPRDPFDRRRLARFETAFLAGYFPDQAVPVSQIRVYEALALLDRWAHHKSRVPTRSGLRARLRRSPPRLSANRFRHEARRLVAQLTDG